MQDCLLYTSTKVIWDPTWSTVELPWRAGGLAIAQTAVLVLFWHPLMSFVVPLAVAERVLGTCLLYTSYGRTACVGFFWSMPTTLP